MATEAGYEAYGVEPSTWAAEQASELGIEVLPGTLDDWVRSFEGFTVDGITMFHVLEHLDDPLATLRTAAKILRPGGHLFVEVPNFGSAGARRLGSEWWGLDVENHALHFTARSLRIALERAGLTVHTIDAISLRPYQSLSAWRAKRNTEHQWGIIEPGVDLLRAVAMAAVTDGVRPSESDLV